MKKIKLLGKVGLVVLVSCFGFAGSAFAQGTTGILKPDSLRQDTVLVKPLAVFQLLKPACMPCHSDAGRDKPKNAVNFSAWVKYTPTEQKMLAASIQSEVNKKSMPPRGFLNSHPAAALTDEQIGKIAQWCDSVKSQPINFLAK